MRILYIFSGFIFICFFGSCQKEFEDPNDTRLNTSSPPEFKAKINGVEFIGELTGAVRRNDNIISIAAKTHEGKNMAFTLVDSGVHVYNLVMHSAKNFCGYEDDHGLAFSSTEGINPGDSGGTLAIVSIDTVKKLLSGTFNLKVFREIDQTQRTITEGVFKNIQY